MFSQVIHELVLFHVSHQLSICMQCQDAAWLLHGLDKVRTKCNAHLWLFGSCGSRVALMMGQTAVMIIQNEISVFNMIPSKLLNNVLSATRVLPKPACQRRAAAAAAKCDNPNRCFASKTVHTA